MVLTYGNNFDFMLLLFTGKDVSCSVMRAAVLVPLLYNPITLSSPANPIIKSGKPLQSKSVVDKLAPPCLDPEGKNFPAQLPIFTEKLLGLSTNPPQQKLVSANSRLSAFEWVLDSVFS